MAKKRVDKAAAGSRRPLLILANGGETAVVHHARATTDELCTQNLRRGDRDAIFFFYEGTSISRAHAYPPSARHAPLASCFPRSFPMLNHVPITDAQRK